MFCGIMSNIQNTRGNVVEKRMLGKTGIELSCLGYGCASVWGKTFYDEKEAMSLFFHAISKGISYFDTGFSYGIAEERLGRCLKQLSSQERSDIVFSTKCGTRIGENGKAYHDWDVKWLKSQFNSLKKSVNYIEENIFDN